MLKMDILSYFLLYMILLRVINSLLVLVEDDSKKMQMKELREDETPQQLHETNTLRALRDIDAINPGISPIIDLMSQLVNHIQVEEMLVLDKIQIYPT